MVNVKVASGELTEEVVGAHSVVVMCGRPGEEVSRWNTFCHEQVGSRGAAVLSNESRGRELCREISTVAVTSRARSGPPPQRTAASRIDWSVL